MSGSDNYLLRKTSATTADTASDLLYSNTVNVGIGTGPLTTGKLQVHNDGSGIKVLNADVANQVFEAYGDNGSLLTISDDLSDSLLRVNDVAGLPVFEVFANDTVIAGQYNQSDLVVTGNKVGVGTSAPASKLSVKGSALVWELLTQPRQLLQMGQ